MPLPAGDLGYRSFPKIKVYFGRLPHSCAARIPVKIFLFQLGTFPAQTLRGYVYTGASQPRRPSPASQQAAFPFLRERLLFLAGRSNAPRRSTSALFLHAYKQVHTNRYALSTYRANQSMAAYTIVYHAARMAIAFQSHARRKCASHRTQCCHVRASLLVAPQTRVVAS